MRRLIGFLFLLLIGLAIGLTIYAYVADLPPPTRVIETPAVGVGFGG